MSHPKNAETKQKILSANPFDGFRISDNSILNTLEGRHGCPKCGKSRKYFCYTCYVPIAELEGKLPKIKLPLKIDIIKHKYEIDGKSTAAHAAVLAPDDVHVYTYPDIPDYENEKVVLIFPSFNAIKIAQLFTEDCEFNEEVCIESINMARKWHESTLKKNDTNKTNNETEIKRLSNSKNRLPITKAVFIDSTWKQCREIYKDERIKKIPSVITQNRISQFWRYQKGAPCWYLSTIEAIHQFLVEVHLQAWGVNSSYKGLDNCFSESKINFDKLLAEDCDTNGYNGQYDDLLYFFHHMYDLIHLYYDHDNSYANKKKLTT